MKKLSWILITFAVCLYAPVFGEVYKWFDDKGIVHYSDKPQANKKSNKTSKKKASIESTLNTAKNSKKLTFVVRQLLKAKKLKQLNRLLEKLQSKTDSDITFETKVLTAYNAFEVNDLSYKILLDDWVKATPNQYQPYLARAKFLYQQGWLQRDNNWISEMKKGQLIAMKNYYSKASQDIDQVLKIKSHAIAVYPLMIAMAMNFDDAESAKFAMEKGLKKHPSSYSIRFIYAMSLIRNDSTLPIKAKSYIKASQKFTSKNPKLKLLRGIIDIDKGDKLAQQGKYNLAEIAYKKAMESGENHYALMKQGKNLFHQKKPKQAIKLLNRAIDLYSEQAEYYYWRSQAYSLLQKYDRASHDIKIAEKLSPNEKYIREYKEALVSWMSYRGYRLSKNKKRKSAAIQYDSAVELDPNNADLFYRRAMVNINAAKYSLAVPDLKKAIELDADEFKYYHNLDYVLAKQKKWGAIIQYWSQYIQRNPDNSRAYVERGGAFFHKGDIKSSLKDAKFAADMGNIDGKQVYEKYKHLVK